MTMRESSGRVAQVSDGDEFYAKGDILASKDGGRFPLKMLQGQVGLGGFALKCRTGGLALKCRTGSLTTMQAFCGREA